LTEEVTEKQSARRLFSARKLALGSTIRVVYLALLTAISFFITPFTVHTLGAQQYGIWALASAFVGFYSLLDLGLSGAVFTRMSHAIGAGDYLTGSKIYATALRLFSALGAFLVVASIVLAVGVLFLRPGNGTTFAITLLIMGLQTAISFPMRAPFGALTAGGHFETTTSVFIVSAIFRAVGTVLVLRAGQGVIGLAIVCLLAWIPGYIFICLAVHRRYPYIRVGDLTKWHGETAKGLLTFGVPVLIGSIADRIRLQTDNIVVSMFLGLSAVAHYTVATTLVMYYMDGIIAIIGVLTPVLAMQTSAKDAAGMRRSLFIGTRLGLCSAGFVAFGLFAWGHAFIARWMGTEYLDAYPVLAILSFAMFLDLVQSTTVNALYAALHQKTYAKINVVEALANIVLSLALAHRYGMIGIALGTLIPAVGRAFIQPFIVRDKLNVRVRDYVVVCWRTSWKTALFLVVPMLVTLRWLRPTYPAMLFVGTVSAIAFALPIWYFEFGGAGWQTILNRLRPLTSRLRSKEISARI
jgi:O-antigen/teichoic acid export membrane protein